MLGRLLVSMLKRLLATALFAQIQLAILSMMAATAAASAEDGSGAIQPGWPGGLPNGWRMLGDGEGPMPPDPPSGSFDFRRDGGVQPPFLQSPNNTTANGAKPNRPAPDDAAARARARAEALKKALAPKPEPAVVRQRTLDDLFKRLGAANDPDTARGFAETIRRLWMQSQSDTAALIMQRATLATEAHNYSLALSLLDKLVALEPSWAEAWNQRATVRFLSEDPDGAMADIDRVIKLEPRHFGALMGMGVILQHAGLEKRALEAYKKALEIYPAQPDLKDTVEKLTIDVNGRDI